MPDADRAAVEALLGRPVQVEPRDGARFHVTFLVRPAELVDEGGEAPCSAHLEPDQLG